MDVTNHGIDLNIVAEERKLTSCYDFGENKINEAFGEHFK
jgi:hypothetical protein